MLEGRWASSCRQLTLESRRTCSGRVALGPADNHSPPSAQNQHAGSSRTEFIWITEGVSCNQDGVHSMLLHSHLKISLYVQGFAKRCKHTLLSKYISPLSWRENKAIQQRPPHPFKVMSIQSVQVSVNQIGFLWPAACHGRGNH